MHDNHSLSNIYSRHSLLSSIGDLLHTHKLNKTVTREAKRQIHFLYLFTFYILTSWRRNILILTNLVYLIEQESILIQSILKPPMNVCLYVGNRFYVHCLKFSCSLDSCYSNFTVRFSQYITFHDFCIQIMIKCLNADSMINTETDVFPLISTSTFFRHQNLSHCITKTIIVCFYWFQLSGNEFDIVSTDFKNDIHK